MQPREQGSPASGRELLAGPFLDWLERQSGGSWGYATAGLAGGVSSAVLSGIGSGILGAINPVAGVIANAVQGAVMQSINYIFAYLDGKQRELNQQAADRHANLSSARQAVDLADSAPTLGNLESARTTIAAVQKPLLQQAGDSDQAIRTDALNQLALLGKVIDRYNTIARTREVMAAKESDNTQREETDYAKINAELAKQADANEELWAKQRQWTDAGEESVNQVKDQVALNEREGPTG